MASVRQINANRKNARNSTGPKTVGGKEGSRGNAYKHGLAGTGVLMDEETERAVAAKLGEWRGVFNLVTKQDEWCFSEFIINTVKLDRARREESFLTAYFIDRAGVMWEADRELEAAELAAKLSDDPGLIARRLKNTAHGCGWLITRWRELLSILEEGGAWDEGQRALMCDLAGIPHDVRVADASDGREPGCPETIAFVRGQIADLEGFKTNGLDEFDGIEQAAAEAGFPAKAPRPLALVRRYITGFTRESRKALAHLSDSGRNTVPRALPPAPPAASPTSRAVAEPGPTAPPPPPPPRPSPSVAARPDSAAPSGEPPVRLGDADARPSSSRHENRRERRSRMKLENRS